MTGWQVSQCPLQSEWNALLIIFFLRPARCGLMQSEVLLNFHMAAAEGHHYSTNLGGGKGLNRCCIIVFFFARGIPVA